jgi:hypothetical protein
MQSVALGKALSDTLGLKEPTALPWFPQQHRAALCNDTLTVAVTILSWHTLRNISG